MHLAIMDLYRAKWTAMIHEEWIRNVQKNRPDLRPQQLQRTRELMDSHVLDCLVTGYEPLISTVNLPDENDRHVVAAAIQAEAHLIITFNLRDFPTEALRQYGLDAQHPDDFLSDQFRASPESVCLAVQRHRASLKNPPQSAAEYLQRLEAQGLPQFTLRLRHLVDTI